MFISWHINTECKDRNSFYFRCPLHATSHVYQDRIKKTIYSNTSGESGSKTDSDLQNVYHTIVPDNGNDHFYDQIHKSERENDQQYVIIQWQ